MRAMRERCGSDQGINGFRKHSESARLPIVPEAGQRAPSA
jgi:hypothetical protein